jgi:aminoglycoside 6'-N-acetyltransferase
MACHVYAFEPFRLEHVPLMAQWLAQPHMVKWWGDPDHALVEVCEAISDPACDPYLVTVDGRALGYIQLYRPHDETDHPYADQPEGTAGIDQSIGSEADLGCGHGSAFIRQFVERQWLGSYVRIITDPDPTNLRAIRAYEKAGFKVLGERTSQFGPALLMACDAPSRTSS